MSSDRQSRSTLYAIAVAALELTIGVIACRREPPPSEVDASPRTAAETLLDDVVDPWTWSRARSSADALEPFQGQRDRTKAVEDIGPYERLRPRDLTSELVNTNAHYWTALAGVAWDRDVDIDLDGEPVDLDGDGRPDTKVTRHIHAQGGILANPALFGLTPTPDDPRGTIGRVSASAGVLGLREALRPDGTPSGEIGMTCWLCHGRANPTDGAIVLGLPGAAFDYGLLLATAAVLDDANTEAAAHRRTRGFPSGRSVRARLLLAGPGRQDLTGEFGLDVTVPHQSARYAGTARVRQGTRGLVNPISVPGILAARGLALENWSGSEDSAAPWFNRLLALAGKPEAEVVRDFALDQGLYGLESRYRERTLDHERVRRALLFDLRNLGTLGLQHDSFPGLLWADALAGREGLSADALRSVHRMYAAAPVRRVLDPSFGRPARDPARVDRGRAIFTDRIVGSIVNRQILKRAPTAYAAAKLVGPVLAPLDASKALDAKIDVRCADCHSGAPLERVRLFADNKPPLGRCTHCHLDHPKIEKWRADPNVTKSPSVDPNRVAITALLPMSSKAPPTEVAFCRGCHDEHRDFGPLVYSSSRLHPFDADGDGDAQLSPEADRRAGGIGTDPWLAFDVPRPEWPFSIELPMIGHQTRAGRVGRARVGVSWVRAAPLVGLHASAPYLHNGSVPTLKALLDPHSKRPKAFPLGKAGFVLDTRLAGNGNQGHEFGTRLSPSEKSDLVAFLETL